MFRIVISLIIFSISITSQAGTESPYSGQQLREIKSLSPSDIDGYLKGKGMGFAKAAELNHYPGPRHVLDLADELKLDDEQLKQTQALFKTMQTRAIELGKQLISQEKELDQLFARNKIDKDSLNSLLQKIGSTQAKLRFVHLSTHLDQKRILNKHQIMMYDQIRGYGKTGNSHDSHMHNHAH